MLNICVPPDLFVYVCLCVRVCGGGCLHLCLCASLRVRVLGWVDVHVYI